MTLAAARSRKPLLDWENYAPPPPARPGIQIWRNWDLADLRGHIDWTPFFHAWELKGKYPEILEDQRMGEEARRSLVGKLYSAELLEKIEKALKQFRTKKN